MSGKSFITPKKPSEHRQPSQENAELLAKLANLETKTIETSEEVVHSPRLPRIVENRMRYCGNSGRRVLKDNNNLSGSRSPYMCSRNSESKDRGAVGVLDPYYHYNPNNMSYYGDQKCSPFSNNFPKGHPSCEYEDSVDDMLMPPNEVLDKAKSRSKLAFKRVTDRYKALLEQKQRQIDEMRELNDGTAPGGSMYMELQRAYEASQSDVRKLQAKVKALVKMLDRAGAAIRLSAEERRDTTNWIAEERRNLPSNSNGVVDVDDEIVFRSRVDWTPLKEVLGDVIVYGRTDDQILNEIVLYIQKLNYQVAHPGRNNGNDISDTSVKKIDIEKETLLKTIQHQKKEIENLSQALAQAW